MCMRDRPTLATRQISILLSVVVGIPRQIYVVITTHSHPRTANLRREIGCADLRDDLSASCSCSLLHTMVRTRV